MSIVQVMQIRSCAYVELLYDKCFDGYSMLQINADTLLKKTVSMSEVVAAYWNCSNRNKND